MKNIITIASLSLFIETCLGQKWNGERIVDELITFIGKQRSPNYDAVEHDNCVILHDGKIDANCDD